MLYHSLQWYTRVYIVRDYGTTCLFYDHFDQCSWTRLSVQEWVMIHYLTPDTVLRDRSWSNV